MFGAGFILQAAWIRHVLGRSQAIELGPQQFRGGPPDEGVEPTTVAGFRTHATFQGMLGGDLDQFLRQVGGVPPPMTSTLDFGGESTDEIAAGGGRRAAGGGIVG